VVSADENGNLTETIRNGRVDRQVFRPKLVIKGEIGQQITGVAFESRSTPYGPDLFSKDTLYLLALYRPFGPNRLIGTGAAGTFFVSESSDQWKFGTPSQAPSLPVGNYTLIGTTPHERASAVLAQAYAFDPKPIFVSALRYFAPRHPTQIKIFPEYASFYVSTIEPRLLQLGGENPERKSLILTTTAIITGEPGYQKFWEFFDHFDATHDPEETVWIEIPLRSREFPKLLGIIRNARTSAARAAAIRASSNYITEENKDIFVAQLSDPNRQVRVAALIALDQIYPHPDVRFRVKRAGRDAIENEEELIRFWRGG